MDLYTRRFTHYLLLPLSAVFYVFSFIRRFCYQIGLFTTHRFNIPVVVVGNITVGGTGKTPVVIALVRYFLRQGRRVGVVSRGYGGTHQFGSLLVDKHTPVSLSGDEPFLIATHAQVPVMVNKNRAQAVQDLINKHQPDLIFSDDGLQHYSMGRTVEICVFNGVGNGLFLPAGPLRESLRRLKSVDFVIKPTLILHKFINLVTLEEKPLNYFAQRTCHAVAGIGRPQHFFDMLQDLGITLIQHPFSDHHFFNKDDLLFGEDYPILMTAKDCVKCQVFATQQMWYLQVEADLSADFLNDLSEKI